MGRAYLLALLLLLAAAGVRAQAGENLTGLADPTRPFTGNAGPDHRRAGLVLQSTLVSPLQRLAVINGRAFTVGERVDGAEIVQIRRYDVTLSRAGRQYLLRLLPKLDIERRSDESMPPAAIR
ncbi:MAG: hypothetical protein ACYDHM_10465 [Acidiferrobacterales bacterium]